MCPVVRFSQDPVQGLKGSELCAPHAREEIRLTLHTLHIHSANPAAPRRTPTNRPEGDQQMNDDCEELVFTYNDRNALDDGVLVDLLANGIKVHLNGKPITRMTSALFDALAEYNPGGSPAEQAAAYQALLGFIIKGAHCDHPEHVGHELYQAPTHETFGGERVWLYPNDDGWTVMFAHDW
jgi:hypothetical protein